ncbi:MAG: low-specificity L-threonine aldolase [Chloroflexi bacterium]|nr:low-specificity L-threonine aldolase [Chloroflexota bacterium]
MIRVDLRSDTVTLPTPEMRRAMAKAEVGDDVYGDDPTTNRLQENAAEILGKEAGLFVTSGTQGNLVSVLTHCTRGDAFIMGDKAHMYQSEAGGTSVLGGIMMKPVPNNPDGTLNPADIRSAGAKGDYHKARVRLLAIENTQNLCGGVVLTPQQTASHAAVAREMGLKVHLDGARIFNASVYLKCDPRKLTKDVDSVTFCLSKGLSCPIGSVICGPKDWIDEANRWRKMLGGGMRQVGIIAAAGIVALDSMIDRLEEDHVNARKLAFGLADIEGVDLDPATVQTNIVRFGVPGGKGHQIAKGLYDEGVYINPGDSSLRVVTHYGIDSEDIDFTLEATRRVMASVNGRTVLSSKAARNGRNGAATRQPATTRGKAGRK